MFKFKNENETEYKVFFKYEKVEVPAVKGKKNSEPHMKPVQSKCIIERVKDREIIAVSTAKCHECDRFEYKTARKILLTRALRYGFSRDARKAAWKSMLHLN